MYNVKNNIYIHINMNVININHEQKQERIIKRRGINKTLTEDEIKSKQTQKRKEINTRHYLKNLDKLRSSCLNNYYKKRTIGERKTGRPYKYINL